MLNNNANLNLSFFQPNLDMIYQTETSECGLACIAMIANYFGYKIDLMSLRDRFSSSNGLNLKTIIDVLSKLNISARAIKVEVEDLDMVDGPSIIHWNMTHFVVLQKVGKRFATIYDPAIGIRKVSIKEVKNSFTGVALEVAPNQKFERRVEKKGLELTAVTKNVKGLKSSLLKLTLLSFTLLAFGILAPFYTQLVMDQVLVGQDRSFLLVVAGGAVCLAFITLLVSIFKFWLAIYFQNVYRYQLTTSLMSHLMALPIKWFEKRHVGDVISRFSSLDMIQRVITNGVVAGILNILTAVFTATIMLIYSAKLFFVVFVGVIIFAVVKISVFSQLRNATQESIVRYAEESSNFIELVKMMSSIKMFARERDRHQEWTNKFVKTMNANIKIEKISQLVSSLEIMIETIGSVCVIWLGALMVLDLEITVGMLFAFIAWRLQFVSAVQGLIIGYFELKMLKLHVSRIEDVALEKREKYLDLDKSDFNRDKVQGGISARGVFYRFDGTGNYLFRGCNIDISPGECVALIGPSGCGKSTLMRLLSGLEFPQQGLVMLDGTQLSKVGLRNYRSICGSVFQADTLRSGTIESNITFSGETSDPEWLRQCLEIACILEDIEKLPMGIKSLVGDMGSCLSAGQEQRVLIARALYQKPKILFLDEAMSNLDLETELKIVKKIEKLDITRIIITHRKEALEYVDRAIDVGAMNGMAFKVKEIKNNI